MVRFVHPWGYNLINHATDWHSVASLRSKSRELRGYDMFYVSRKQNNRCTSVQVGKLQCDGTASSLYLTRDAPRKSLARVMRTGILETV